MISLLETDLYQLTMIHTAWKHGLHNRQSVFYMFYRTPPCSVPYVVSAGLGSLLQDMSYAFDSGEEEYLRGMFEKEFVDFLMANGKLLCKIYAVPEGTLVYPGEPIIRVEGPYWQAQLLESIFLNVLNFQSLIATKASVICGAAKGKPVLDFALRRCQGPNGALYASRAAYIGGCFATSNVKAGQLYDIPIKGTHAHSWVQFFHTEKQAFEKYVEVNPGNVTLLIDTYEPIRGLETAIEVCREKHIELNAIRIDSGDLAYLSKSCRHILNHNACFTTKIVASNDLDETSITALEAAQCPIDIYGVGTRLGTSYDRPALGGVYKLAMIEDDRGIMSPRMKLSESDPIKSSLPGRLNFRRCSDKYGIHSHDIIDITDKHGELVEVTPTEDTLKDLQSFVKIQTSQSLHPIEMRLSAELKDLMETTQARIAMRAL